MTSIRLSTHRFDLRLKHEFSISRSSVSVQPTMIVQLSDGTHRGFGEATSNDYYGTTIERMMEAVEKVRGIIEGVEELSPEGLWHHLHEFIGDEPFALCALDQAAWDLWGKQQGQPLHRLWGLKTDSLPVSNFTIGIDSAEGMVAKLKEVPGWPIYKIKLGTEDDLKILRELRRHTDAVFRVDANCGWDVEQTLANAVAMKELGVEFIEQPLPADDWDGAKELRRKSALPLMADESCMTESDVERCEGCFHGVNIKLVKCGGLTPARRMIRDARQRDLKVMVGCMTESSVGISAIGQILPLLDYVDMDGAELLAEDIASGVKVTDGICHYAKENGTGAELLRDSTES